MALILLVLILCLMFALARKGKSHKKQKNLRRRDVDELATIILPTIRNDK